jgi:hypothetical protein
MQPMVDRPTSRQRSYINKKKGRSFAGTAPHNSIMEWLTRGLGRSHGHRLGRCGHHRGWRRGGGRATAACGGATTARPARGRNALGRAFLARVHLLDQEMPRIGVLAMSGLAIAAAPQAAVEKAQAKRLAGAAIVHDVFFLHVLLRHARIVASTTLAARICTTAARSRTAPARSRTAAAHGCACGNRHYRRRALSHQGTDPHQDKSNETNQKLLHLLSPRGHFPL